MLPACSGRIPRWNLEAATDRSPAPPVAGPGAPRATVHLWIGELTAGDQAASTEGAASPSWLRWFS
jgi:hypothetical protein